MSLFSLRSLFRPSNSPYTRLSAPSQNLAPCLQHKTPASTSPFSSTAQLQKRRRQGPVSDPRITNIRYHLQHPLTPRPLHFSRNRHLRHWTIHRAWLLFLRKRRWAEERELERQYMSMRAACEHLRLLDLNGNKVREEEAGGQGPDPGQLGPRGRDVGRLYRSAMLKRGIWGSVPVEYARMQTDYPPRDGWNHEWKRD